MKEMFSLKCLNYNLIKNKNKKLIFQGYNWRSGIYRKC